MSMNEADTRYHLIDPVLREKGYVSRECITLETVLTPAPVEPSGPKGRRRRGPGRTDYLLCVQVGDMPKALPVAVLEAKKETDDPLKGMQQARGYADTLRFNVKYVFATNGHRYGEYDRFTKLINGPFQFSDFPAHPDLTARYAKDSGIDLTRPEATMLFQADSPAWSQSRYYQDAAIRAAFAKLLRDGQSGKPPRVLLTLATGAGKTIIATNLLWRLRRPGSYLNPPCSYAIEMSCAPRPTTSSARHSEPMLVSSKRRGARTRPGTPASISLPTKLWAWTTAIRRTVGFASFLTEHYGQDAFSVIIIDECHRSAWGRWSEVLRRNPNAIHIGLTATPRKLEESDKASKEDQEITANNRQYFGEPVYEYTLIQAQEDGYLAACEIVKRKASIDSATFTKEEVLKAGAKRHQDRQAAHRSRSDQGRIHRQGLRR
jgi:type I restriction enzyme R subunit